jgi:hypothetical protein
MVTGCLHDNPVSNGGQLQAIKELKLIIIIIIINSSRKIT